MAPAFFHKSSEELLAEAGGSTTALTVLPSIGWRGGADLTLSSDRLSIRREPGSGEGPRVALCDRWLTHDCTEITLHCQCLGEDAVLGVVDRNFCGSDRWWQADLTHSRHATVVHLASGHCYFRGRRTRFLGSLPLALPRARVVPAGRDKSAEPVVCSGDLLRVEVDQRRHEMTVELCPQGGGLPSSVVLDELPSESVLALGLGAGSHCVRILGERQRPADGPPLPGENRRSLWDPHRFEPPLRTAAAQRNATAVREADTWDLQRALQEAVANEAARVGG